MHNLPSNIPLMKDVLHSCGVAYSAYQPHMKKEKEQERSAAADKIAAEEKSTKSKVSQGAQHAKNKARKEKECKFSTDDAHGSQCPYISNKYIGILYFSYLEKIFLFFL